MPIQRSFDPKEPKWALKLEHVPKWVWISGALVLLVYLGRVIRDAERVVSKDVRNSSWDGSVWQVKNWLDENLNDPSSVDYVKWWPVEPISNGTLVRVKYRAKNALGAYVLTTSQFVIRESGEVIRMQ